MIDQWNLSREEQAAAWGYSYEQAVKRAARRDALREKILNELLADGEWHPVEGKGWVNLRQAWAIIFEAGKEGLVEYDGRGSVRLKPSR